MSIKLKGSTDGSVKLAAPADTSPTGTDVTLTLPTSAGSAGQYLRNSGTPGTLEFGALPDSGKILQVVQASKTDAFTTTNSTFTDVTGLSVSITPSSSSNKVLVMAMIGYGGITSGTTHIKVVVNSSDLLIGDTAGSRVRTNFSKNNYSTEADAPGSHFSYLHSPASTSAQTYKVQVRSAAGGTAAINRTSYDGDNVYYARFASTIIAMEVAG